ncbi:MAG TPA: hypothetical protein VFV99_03110 [Kofleriaceae bacterium]|nr:hypothetical protein [Kofleriaceae bacterium]
MTKRLLVTFAVGAVAAPTLAHAQGAMPVARPVPLYDLPPPPPEPPPPVDPSQEILDEDPPPMPDLPPAPDSGPPPPPAVTVSDADRPTFTRPSPVPSLRRTGFHLGTTYGFEVARDGGSSFAMGGGAQLGVEIYWPQIAIELGVAVQAHGDTTTMPDHGFWEAHPMVYLKRPFKDGVWEFFAGYGASPASFHAGDFAGDEAMHVLEAGFEDRTKWMYSRLFVRWYAPFDGDLFGSPTAIVGASVGLFHFSKQKH